MIILASLLSAGCSRPGKTEMQTSDSWPVIFPDYKGVTVPPDIAPLNFMLTGDFDRCSVEISGKDQKITRYFRGRNVTIPGASWSKLIYGNRDGSIIFTVAALKGRIWKKFKPFAIHITDEPADDYLVYRLLMPGFQNWNRMGIYQRSVSGFRVRTVLDSRIMPGTCMNCHSFPGNDPENMVLHLRESYGGTLLYTNGTLEKLTTRTGRMFASAAFPYWHPSKRYIAFSVNRVNQIFHAAGPYRATALDLRSDIVLYDVKEHEMKIPPQLSAENKFETFPCFSPDGKKLYFCSAEEKKLPAELKNTRYSLCSVDFDEETGAFGSVTDTLISSHATGKSISIPRVSPNGKYLMFTVSDYGAFPSYNPEADLWIMDLETGQYHPADSINSPETESYHSWSSNSRWVAFSSRRSDKLFSDIYLAYMDKDGDFHKPFLLPQKDPEFYGSTLFSFNLPEFSVRDFPVDPYRLAKAAKSRSSLQVQPETGTH